MANKLPFSSESYPWITLFKPLFPNDTVGKFIDHCELKIPKDYFLSIEQALYLSSNRIPFQYRISFSICKYLFCDSWLTPIECRYFLSGLVIRSVNIICDQYQCPTRIQVVSVLNLAKIANLPLSLVDTRHNATHGHMPSLSQLRNAVIKLYFYLYDTFWAPLFEQYLLASKNAMKANMSFKPSSVKQSTPAITKLLECAMLPKTFLMLSKTFISQLTKYSNSAEDFCFMQYEHLLFGLHDIYPDFQENLFNELFDCVLNSAVLSHNCYMTCIDYITSEKWMFLNNSSTTSGDLVVFNRDAYPSFLYFFRLAIRKADRAAHSVLSLLVPKFYAKPEEILRQISILMKASKFRSLNKKRKSNDLKAKEIV